LIATANNQYFLHGAKVTNSTDKNRELAESAAEQKRETKLLLSKAKFFTLSWIGGIVLLVLAYVIYRQVIQAA
jgi:hypothetical protein